MGPRVFRQFFGVCGLIALAACGSSNNSPASPTGGGTSSGGTTTGTLSAADQADIATLTSNAYSKWFSGIGTALTQTGGTGSVGPDDPNDRLFGRRNECCRRHVHQHVESHDRANLDLAGL